MEETLYKRTLKDVIYMIAESWEVIKSPALVNLWKITEQTRLQNAQEHNSTDEEYLLRYSQSIPLTELIHANDIAKWMHADDEQEMTGDLIAEAVTQDSNHSDNETDIGICKNISNMDSFNQNDYAIHWTAAGSSTAVAQYKSFLLSKICSVHKTG